MNLQNSQNSPNYLVCVCNVESDGSSFGVRMLRYIIFDDGTMFEFNGHFGSLRNVYKIAIEDYNILSTLSTFHYKVKEKDDILYDILTKNNCLIQEYTEFEYSNPEELYKYIWSCFILEKESSDVFIERMITKKHNYTDTNTDNDNDIDVNLFLDYFNRT